MDAQMMEVALLLSLVLPLLVVTLCLLFYANWTIYSKAKVERQKLNSKRTITRNHKRLFVIDSERD